MITEVIDENDNVFIVREIEDGIGHCTCDAFIAGRTCQHLEMLGLIADDIDVQGSELSSSGSTVYHQFIDSVGTLLCTCKGSAYRYQDCACKHSKARA
ncbi:MAG: hypothetical protein WDA42_09215 [Candidatus Bathyarchaeia archaeon]